MTHRHYNAEVWIKRSPEQGGEWFRDYICVFQSDAWHYAKNMIVQNPKVFSRIEVREPGNPFGFAVWDSSWPVPTF